MRSIVPPLVLLCLIAAASGAGAAGPGETPRWLPTEVGNRWTYDFQRERTRTQAGQEQVERFRGTLVDRVTRAATATSQAAVEIRSRLQGRSAEAPADRIEEGTRVVESVGSRVRLFAREAPHPVTGEMRRIRYAEPAELIRPEAGPGRPWALPPIDHAGLHSEFEAEILGVQDVRTPAGLYPDCLVVRTVGTHRGRVELYDQSLSVEEGRSTTTAWYAPGVGLVLSKSERDDTLRLEDGSVLELSEKSEYALSEAVLATEGSDSPPDPPPAAPALPPQPVPAAPAPELEPTPPGVETPSPAEDPPARPAPAPVPVPAEAPAPRE